MKTHDLENWRTGISQAYWCHLNELDPDKAFEPALDIVKSNYNDRNDDCSEKPICWFDKLFRGGIKVPDTTERPLSFLFTGPPGSGKSSLALELCYKLAKNEIYLGLEENEALNREAKNSIYISSESTGSQILQKADEFNWKPKDIILQYSNNLIKTITDNELDDGRVILFDSEQFNKGKNLIKMVSSSLRKALPIFKILAKNIPISPEYKASINAGLEVTSKIIDRQNKSVNKKPDKKRLSYKSFGENAKKIGAQIAVIDSLNSIPKEKQKEKTFNSFLKALSGNIKIVIFILDSSPNSVEHKFWEYLCDNVLHLDSDTIDDYWMRTIEIKKARFQEHVHGKQIFKICSCNESKRKDFASPIEPRYSHPYRKDGGLFIYPSIHYFLSRYKRIHTRPTSKQKYAEAYPLGLNSLVSEDKAGLIPEGRCTALLGQRGTHKSHLGYLHLLNRMLKFKESAMVVSLRDDEAMTKQTMCSILEQEPELKQLAKKIMPDEECNDEADIIKWLENNGRFEILYYHPGYITPEEFTHRMIMSVQHIKYDGQKLKVLKKVESSWDKLTLMFNSLDQLSSRFPLCARQDIFVPGLIDSLNGENVTSIFVSVETNSQPSQQYGLLPMADLVLSFKTKEISYLELINNISKYKRANEDDNSYTELKEKKKDKKYTTVFINISRFAGGEMAGAQGSLELITQENHEIMSLIKKKGLHFIPLY